MIHKGKNLLKLTYCHLQQTLDKNTHSGYKKQISDSEGEEQRCSLILVSPPRGTSTIVSFFGGKTLVKVLYRLP